LNRHRIVEAALALMDDEGMDRLTMPRIAARLGVGTMSLYRHVRNKADLVEAVAERIFEDLDIPPGPEEDWEERVVGYLLRWRRLAIAHPALAAILASRPLGVRRFYEHLETIMTIMKRAGFSDHDAVRTFYSLFTYVFGFVLWELPRARDRAPGEYMAATRHDIDELPTDRFPALTATRHLLATDSTQEQFQYGLERLVDSCRPAAASGT
jgi:AcrR family transcriptional regulator